MSWVDDFWAWLKPPAVKPAVVSPAVSKLSSSLPLSLTGPLPLCGVYLLKKVERCELTGYLDSAGVPTDGYGNTFGARAGAKITQAKADADLVHNCAWAWVAVQKHVKVPLTANQGGALLSFVFNVGEPEFVKSELLTELNQGNYVGVPMQLRRFIYITVDGAKQVSAGLVNRRNAEAALWVGADWRQA